MITRTDYEQLKAFARNDGGLVGLLWVLSFACFIGQFSHPMLSFASFIFCAGSLVFATLRLRRFRDYARDGYITFRHAYVYCMFVFFYAAVIMAGGQYIYFQFFDHGFMVSEYAKALSTPEYKALLQAWGARESDIQLFIGNLSALRPIDIALQFFTSNILFGVFISLPMACIMRRVPIKNI